MPCPTLMCNKKKRSLFSVVTDSKGLQNKTKGDHSSDSPDKLANYWEL